MKFTLEVDCYAVDPDPERSVGTALLDVGSRFAASGNDMSRTGAVHDADGEVLGHYRLDITEEDA